VQSFTLTIYLQILQNNWTLRIKICIIPGGQYFYFTLLSSVAVSKLFLLLSTNLARTRGRVVVKALCYKSEGRWFGPDEVNDFFSIYLILPAALGPEVNSASNRNKYQKQKNVSGE
jgi:hypothetical protein